MVFFRGPEGKVAAVEDFCPHRGAPLSLGKVCDGKLVCGYHGLEMGCEGKTVHMPGQRVRGFPAIKSYAVIERYGFVWVWPGDQSQVDATLMPSFEFFDNPEWAYGGGLYHVKADYRLMIDNLMDLTHETYVHANSIGQPEIDETPCKTTVEGDKVILQRHMEGIQAPPFWQMAMSANGLDPNAKVDRWQICRFTPPTHIMIDVGVALAGRGGFNASPEDKAYSVVVDFITPETETSHWYHWGMARQFKPNDADLTVKIREGQGKIFNEDMEMLQLQQANISLWPERKLLLLNIDSGGVQSRRIIDRMLAQEQEQEQNQVKIASQNTTGAAA
jgi:vanillate O-demethylase monooxygenase subunit